MSLLMHSFLMLGFLAHAVIGCCLHHAHAFQPLAVQKLSQPIACHHCCHHGAPTIPESKDSDSDEDSESPCHEDHCWYDYQRSELNLLDLPTTAAYGLTTDCGESSRGDQATLHKRVEQTPIVYHTAVSLRAKLGCWIV